MLATGLVLMFIGWLIVNILGAPYSMFTAVWNKWDTIGVLIALAGVLSAVAGAVTWLWRNAP